MRLHPSLLTQKKKKKKINLNEVSEWAGKD